MYLRFTTASILDEEVRRETVSHRRFIGFAFAETTQNCPNTSFETLTNLNVHVQAHTGVWNILINHYTSSCHNRDIHVQYMRSLIQKNMHMCNSTCLIPINLQ